MSEPVFCDLIDGAALSMEPTGDRRILVRPHRLVYGPAYATPEQLAQIAREAADLAILTSRQPAPPRPRAAWCCPHERTSMESCAECGRSVTK